jgi:hypothetical protein
VPDHGLRRLITRYLEFDDLAEAPIPLHLVPLTSPRGARCWSHEGRRLSR